MTTRIYVGNLPLDIKERELDDLFYKYGKIRSIDVKTPGRPPAFAFVEFDDPLDAQDACKGRDGYNFYDNVLRVEPSMGRGGPRGGPPPRAGGGGYGGGGGGGGGGGSARSLGPSPFGPSRRTDFRVIVTGLPISASWQDLKDHMRRAGDVTFTQVMRDGRDNMGLVDFAYEDDLLTALDKLDKSEFKNPFDRCTIRVKEDRAHLGGTKRTRSRSPMDSRSRSRSPRRSVSRSRSRSPARKDSRSRSRSPLRKDSRSLSRSPVRKDSRSRSRSRSASR